MKRSGPPRRRTPLQARSQPRQCGRRYPDEDSATHAARKRCERSQGRSRGYLPARCAYERGCGGWHVVSRRDAARIAAAHLPARDTGPSQKVKLAVAERDGWACACCGQTIIGQVWDVQHRKRRSQGGSNKMSNLICGLREHHNRWDSRADPEDEARGYTVRSWDEPALVPVMYFEGDGSGLSAYLTDDGRLVFEAPAGVSGAPALRSHARGDRPSRCSLQAPEHTPGQAAHRCRTRGVRPAGRAGHGQPSRHAGSTAATGRRLAVSKQRAGWAGLAFAVYVAAIVLSNWLIGHVGIPTGPGGPHLTPVGFGLMAPSGVWAAAASFPARDIVQRTGGRWLGVAAILLGAGISYLISNPVIAVASGVTYLCSETADFAVYTPLQRRWFTPAVVASGCVAAVVDSVLFLHLAGLPAGIAAVAGLVLGKVWVQLAAGAVTWRLRKAPALAVAAP